MDLHGSRIPVKLDPQRPHQPGKLFRRRPRRCGSTGGIELGLQRGGFNPSNGRSIVAQAGPQEGGVIVLPGQGRPGGAQMDMVGLAVALTVNRIAAIRRHVQGSAASREWRATWTNLRCSPARRRRLAAGRGALNRSIRDVAVETPPMTGR